MHVSPVYQYRLVQPISVFSVFFFHSAVQQEQEKVKKIEFKGKKYLKSKTTGIVYDYEEYIKNGEQVVVGKWNETTNAIDFTAKEEEEEEYEM